MDTLTPSERSARMARVKCRNTKPEIRVRRAAHALGLRFRLHRRDLPGCPDLVLPKYRVVIFVHGCFWHRHPGCALARLPKSRLDFWVPKLEMNRARDLSNFERLKTLNWRPIVVWECETLDPATLSETIAARIREATCAA